MLSLICGAFSTRQTRERRGVVPNVFCLSFVAFLWTELDTPRLYGLCRLMVVGGEYGREFSDAILCLDVC